MGAGLRIKCTKCHDIIQSTFRHDYVLCSCESTFVDGGDAYCRCGGEVELHPDGSIVIYDDEGDAVVKGINE